MIPRRFDPPALYAALSAERIRRGVNWAVVAAESGVAESTIRRTSHHGRFEVDGVLALLAWLGRPLEDFTRPGEAPAEPSSDSGRSAQRVSSSST